MMLFQHTVDRVLDGSKVATSRIVKPGDGIITDFASGRIDIVTSKTNRYVYELGKDYAVQPGRGQKAVGRIRITGIERYDVRSISWSQLKAEGFKDFSAFIAVWSAMHDPTFHARWAGEMQYLSAKYDDMRRALTARQAAKYDAWYITFELLKGAV
jgi:hypothetical protein